MFDQSHDIFLDRAHIVSIFVFLFLDGLLNIALEFVCDLFLILSYLCNLFDVWDAIVVHVNQ